MQPDLKFQLTELPEKGLGVVATTNIQAGTVLVCESPLFQISSERIESSESKVNEHTADQVRKLDKEQQRTFLSLRNNFPSLLPFHGIVKTNSIPLGNNAVDGGIFPICSRFNHSCASNAAFSWNSKLQRERIFSIKDIKEGDEISVNYLRDDAWMSQQHERKHHLSEVFGFDCACEVCNASEDERVASDDRRVQLSFMDQMIGDGISIIHSPSKVLGFCRKSLDLMELEGETGMMIHSILYDAFQICAANNDMARASCFASLALEKKIVCQGEDSNGF